MLLLHTNIQSVLLFIILLILTYLLARLAEKMSNKAQVPVLMIILLLSLVCGLRDITVGRDTANYYIDIKNALAGYNQSLQYYEIGFQIIVKLILLVTNSVQFVFFIISFLTIFLIIKRLWEMREFITFSSSIIYFYSIIFSSLFSGFRQWLAIAIVFYASRYIERRKYLIFIIYVVAAALIHLSALITVISLGMYFLFSRHMQKRIILRVLIFLLALIGFATYYSIDIKIVSGLTRYSLEAYFSETDIGFMIFSRIILLFLFLLNYKHFAKIKKFPVGSKLNYCSAKDTRNFHIQQYFPYIIGSIIGGIYGSSVARIAWYFLPFECAIFAGNVVAKKHWSYPLIQVIVIIISLYSLYSFVLRGIPGLTPYKFFWE